MQLVLLNESNVMFELVVYYAKYEIFTRRITKMSMRKIDELLSWLDNDQNKGKVIPIENIRNIFLWNSDKENLIIYLKHEKYKREVKELSDTEVKELYEILHDPQYQDRYERLSSDISHISRILVNEIRSREMRTAAADGVLTPQQIKMYFSPLPDWNVPYFK